MLMVEDLHVYYGESHVIRGVSFELGKEETIALMGRNGMGKTTLFKSLIGILPARTGRLCLGGADITGKPSYEGAWGMHGVAAQRSYLAATARWTERLRSLPSQ